MAWLGVRCWKDKVAMALVSEESDQPRVEFSRREPSPKGQTDTGKNSYWFWQVIDEALEESSATGIAIVVSAGDADQTRAMYEGAVAAAAGARDMPVVLLRKQGMWKPLGLQDAKSATWDSFMREDQLLGELVGDLKEAAAASLVAERRGSA